MNLCSIDALLYETKESDRNKRHSVLQSEILIVKVDDYLG